MKTQYIKAQLTREIKSVTANLNEVKEIVERCEKTNSKPYYHGDWAIPVMWQLERELFTLISKRNKL